MSTRSFSACGIEAQLCIRHDLTLLTNDKDFAGIASHNALRVTKPWQNTLNKGKPKVAAFPNSRLPFAFLACFADGVF